VRRSEADYVCRADPRCEEINTTRHEVIGIRSKYDAFRHVPSLHDILRSDRDVESTSLCPCWITSLQQQTANPHLHASFNFVRQVSTLLRFAHQSVIGGQAYLNTSRKLAALPQVRLPYFCRHMFGDPRQHLASATFYLVKLNRLGKGTTTARSPTKDSSLNLRLNLIWRFAI
jgi:hypothetical protein